jgi:hypothetical protein
METSVQWVVINTPASNKAVDRFKAKFPNAAFYGSATLGSKRKSYLLSVEDFEQEKDVLKDLKVSKARHQPFLKK